MLRNVYTRMSFAGSESFFTKVDSKLGQLHEQLEVLEVRMAMHGDVWLKRVVMWSLLRSR